MIKSLQLVKACKEEDLDQVKKLLQCNLNVNATDNSGWTGLHHAACYRQFRIVEALLQNGANPNIKNQLGQTALDMVFSFYQAKEAAATLYNIAQINHTLPNPESNKAEFKESTCHFSKKTHEETLRLFKLIYKPQASVFDAERIFSYCKKYGIPQIADILVRDGYNINKIRKQRQLDEKMESRNNKLREKKLQKILFQKGYIMRKIGPTNPAYRHLYHIIDRKTENWAQGIDSHREGVTLDRIEKFFHIKH